MDAVATNLGVDASKLALPLVKPALPDPNLTTAVNPTADWRDRPVSGTIFLTLRLSPIICVLDPKVWFAKG